MRWKEQETADWDAGSKQRILDARDDVLHWSVVEMDVWHHVGWQHLNLGIVANDNQVDACRISIELLKSKLLRIIAFNHNMFHRHMI